MRPLACLAVLACLLPLAAGCGSDSGSSEPSNPPGVQPAGVYEYDTSGAERIGGPLPGRHRYGPHSTVAVNIAGCRLTERWDAVPERWTEWTYCITGDNWQLDSVTDHHEFFGQVEENSYRCSGRDVPRPAQIKVGFRWTDRCRARRVTAIGRGEVVAIEAIRAAGAQVGAVHLRVNATLAGRVTGGYVMDSWLRRSDGLLLRRTFESRTRLRSVVGTVPDQERYTLDIRSLTPQE
jgi:hypothetical protein